jgi:hypothetical protein
VCHRGIVRVKKLLCTLYLIWKFVPQEESSSYVVNVHPVLAMEVCATREMFDLGS